MCGRSRQAAAPNALAQAAARDAGVPSHKAWKHSTLHKPCENLCPGRTAAVVVQASSSSADDGSTALVTMRWGLVPSYDKSAAPDYWKMFNARSETLHTSPVFRRLLKEKRCAVPLDGFFEWTSDELKQGGKQPWYVYRTSSAPLWIAGLYDGPSSPSSSAQESSDHPLLDTFTLITRDVDAKLSWLHDRQPVILDAEGLARWLAPPSLEPPLDALLSCRLSVAELAWHPTTKKMSTLSYQEADTASPVRLPSQQQKSVASFFGKRSTGGEAPPSASAPPPCAAAVKEELPIKREHPAGATSESVSAKGAGDGGGPAKSAAATTPMPPAAAKSEEVACPACTFLQRPAATCEVCGSALQVAAASSPVIASAGRMKPAAPNSSSLVGTKRKGNKDQAPPPAGAGGILKFMKRE